MKMPLKSKQPRVAPVEPPYDEETARALDLLGPPIQLFRVFARRPELAQGIAGWGHYYLSRRSALTLRQRELVIFRTTALCGADYEWGVHVAHFSDRAGIDDDQRRSLAAGSPFDPCWSSVERALLVAVDELHAASDLGEETWTDLRAALDADAAVEVTLLAGWYHAISYAVNALRLPLEDGTRPIGR